jgi:hypothetical protein
MSELQLVGFFYNPGDSQYYVADSKLATNKEEADQAFKELVDILIINIGGCAVSLPEGLESVDDIQALKEKPLTYGQGQIDFYGIKLFNYSMDNGSRILDIQEQAYFLLTYKFHFIEQYTDTIIDYEKVEDCSPEDEWENRTQEAYFKAVSDKDDTKFSYEPNYEEWDDRADDWVYHYEYIGEPNREPPPCYEITGAYNVELEEEFKCEWISIETGRWYQPFADLAFYDILCRDYMEGNCNMEFINEESNGIINNDLSELCKQANDLIRDVDTFKELEVLDSEEARTFPRVLKTKYFDIKIQTFGSCSADKIQAPSSKLKNFVNSR